MAKGWFRIPGVQDGDRTIKQQLEGLGPMLAEVEGKRVLDLGCADGAIAGTCLARGAREVLGIDFNATLIATARRVYGGHYAKFVHGDLSKGPDRDDLACCHSDIVLMLAVLHKMPNPAAVLRGWAPLAHGLLVIRLPKSTPGFIQDRRSGMVKVPIAETLGPEFRLEREERGHEDEWMGYYRRAR